MRRISIVWLLLLFGAVSQSQSVVNASRYFPKADKVQEFEKALAAHVAKYHSGDWKWRVYDIQTGPDAGGYHITEGPKTWDEFDKRGNLGEDHMKDWNKTVAPYLTDRYSSLYAEFQEDLSTVQVGDFSDKILITHVFPKVGMGNVVATTIRQAKNAWAAGNQSVAVYQSTASGPSQYALVYRLKEGLKELQNGYRKPMRERFEGTNGATYDYWLGQINEGTESAWSEMLFYRPDLSAK